APGTPHATAAPGTPHAASNITVSAPEATAGTPSGAENTERAQYRAAAPGGQAYAGQRMQGTPTGHGNVANIQHFDLPPITKVSSAAIPYTGAVDSVCVSGQTKTGSILLRLQVERAPIINAILLRDSLLGLS